MGQGHKLSSRVIPLARASTLEEKCPGPRARLGRRWWGGDLKKPLGIGCGRSHVDAPRTSPSSCEVPGGTLRPIGTGA